MHRTYAIAALTLLLIAGIVGQQAVSMRFYTYLGPGAGFFPAILAGLLALLSVSLLYQALFRPDTLPRVAFTGDPRAYARIATVLLALLAIAVFIEDLGFRPMMALFFFVMFAVLGRHRLLLSATLAITLTFAYHFFFKSLLNVPLPSGAFGL
ncbi:tripartite tricarboxylate transporter TctB family protein [Stappia stellulata]|uniref:tripartite tricarboxylate transporter TctB family protein n=1 Tax=Stappia stellulata TaxID=71235 RepID=UPI00041B99D0|nr:tripartite tricarboxylate transporter TctB family protein [Stappia stellulata]